MDINYVAVIIAAVVNMAMGMLWYSPVLFGTQWLNLMKAEDKNFNPTSEAAKQGYMLTSLAALVMAFVLAIFVDYAGADSWVEGMMIGIWAWVGFVATGSLYTYVYEGKNLKLYAIYVGYQLAAMLIMGGVIGALN